ncbi:MAG: hypothetical protein WKG01_32075 [Kofleriaceae bacterium]
MSVEKWDQRTLCPDGACIGVISDDGTCNTCGRAAPNWGEERKRGLRDESGPIATADLAAIDPIEPAAPARIGKPPAWHERQLCSDGGCIGLIGADGTCKVCGRAAGAPVDSDDDDDDDDDDDEADYEDEDYEGDDDSEGEDFVDEDDPVGKAEQVELEAAADELAAMLPAEAVPPATVDRALCPDGGCVGLVGDDGRCKVCGKEAV